MDDARIARGTAAMLELRRARLAEGDRPIGWKVGFGSQAAFELLRRHARDRQTKLVDVAEIVIQGYRLLPSFRGETSNDSAPDGPR